MKKENQEILLEELNSKLDLLLELYELKSNKIDRLAEVFKEQFAMLASEIRNLSQMMGERVK